jgi:thiol:disulfide interchange protein DsbC
MIFLALILLFFTIEPAYAFQKDGCAGDCKGCHSLTQDEASILLTGFVKKVVKVEMSPVKGLWEVTVEANGKKLPVYIDFSKKYLVSGDIIKLATKESITRERIQDLNPVDVAKIPLGDALVMGRRTAKKRVIIFDDPDCSFCAKLHNELKKILEKRRDIVFYIKLFPLESHAKAYEKSKTILCEKSIKLLEDSFAGKEITPPKCNTNQVDVNISLAKSL